MELTAFIGLSGPVRGAAALAFSTRVAVGCVSKLLETDIKVVDATVIDGISELVNITTGNAKTPLTGEDTAPVNLSLPAVVRGHDYILEHPSDTIWLTVPFTCGLGPFLLRVTLANNGVAGELPTKDPDR